MNYRYVWKELRHHHHRTLVNILGIGIGIALFVSINAVSTAYKEAVSLPFKNLGADIVVQRPEKRSVDSTQAPASMRGIRLPFSNQILPRGDLEKLRSLEGVDSTASSLLLWEFRISPAFPARREYAQAGGSDLLPLNHESFCCHFAHHYIYKGLTSGPIASARRSARFTSTPAIFLR